MNEMYFDTILMDVKATNAKQVYQKLAEHVANLIGTPEQFLLEMITDNEERHNSGVSHGVAIAHAQLPRLTRPMIIFSKIEDLVDFHAADGEPVDMVALVLSPEFEGSKHLQRLARVTRFFNEAETRMALRNADDFEAVRNVVKEANALKKAA